MNIQKSTVFGFILRDQLMFLFSELLLDRHTHERPEYFLWGFSPICLILPIDASMPSIRIEQLLMEVDKLTGFSRHFASIQQHGSKPKNFYKTLIAAIKLSVFSIIFHDIRTKFTIFV